jgi:hypothetical protein
MAAVLAVEILFLPRGKTQELFALMKIVMLTVLIEFSVVFMFPAIVGVDPWWHQMFTLSILKTGAIPGGEPYSQLPFMHLLIGSFSLITGLDYKISAFISVSFTQALYAITFTFLIGSRLFNRKVGLLGALLLGIANYELSMGISPVPNTMATIFALSVVYLLLKTTADKPLTSVRATFLMMFFMGALILTHTVTSAFVLLLLVVFCIGFEFYNRTYNKGRNTVPVITTVLFSAGVFSWWTYASGHIKYLATLIESGFSLARIVGTVPSQVIEYSTRIPLLEQLFKNGGMYLFCTISLIGCLYTFSKYGSSRAFVVTACGVVTLTLAFFAPIAGSAIISERWFYFSQILLSLPLAIGLLMFCWKMKNRLAKSLLLASLTFLLTFTMILSPTANIDNPTFSPNTQIRFAFTRSELQALETVASISSKKTAVDLYYSVLGYSFYPTQNIGESIYRGSYGIYGGEPILIREEVVNRPFEPVGGWGAYKLDYDPRETLTVQGFDRIYDCCSVSGFILPAS